MKIKFIPSLIYVLIIITLLRLAELIGIAVQVPKQEYGLLGGLTLAGWVTDLIFVVCVVLVLNLLFKSKGISKVVHYLVMFVFHIALLAHLPLLVYYIHQRMPLGIIFYQHNYDEVYLTATNSGYSMKYLLLIFIATVLLFVGLYFGAKRLVKRKEWLLDKKKGLMLLGGCVTYLIVELTCFSFRDESYYVNNSKYFYSESVQYYWEKTHPVSLQRNDELIAQFQKAFSQNYIHPEYPLLHTVDTVDYLAEYFEKFDDKPNVVFLIVEGLNDDFIHNQHGLTLMPYLNKLKDQSLYWRKCFTLGERSFAAVPSLLGSLPYGNKGFMQLEAYPRFTSMVIVLKSNEYHVRFNYGQGAWFHSKDQFFKWQDVDVIFDKEVFDPKLTKMIVDDGYFWGYDDITFLSEAIKNLDSYPKQPFMEVYFTGSMHSPYIIPNQDQYLKRFRKSLNQITDEAYKAQLKAFEKYYVTTLVTDAAIEQFITAYAKRPDFENTIFVISGDHPMTEAPIQNSLKRYHVPLMIYSPKLVRPAVSDNVVSHLDVQQTLYNILRKYKVNVPETSIGLGDVLKVKGQDRNRTLVFMNGHRFVEDIYSNGYFLANNQLYKVQGDFKVEKVLDADKKKELSNALEAFKWMSLYTTNQQRLLPANHYLKAIGKQAVGRFVIAPANGNTNQYQDWLKDVEVNQNAMLEIYFKDQTHSSDLRIVVSLKNKEDETYFYQDIFCNLGKTYSQKIPLTIKQKGDLLQVYVYNPSNAAVKIYGAEVLLYNR